MRLRLLGGFAIEDERGRQPRLPTRKTSLLLAALALAGERGFRREALAELVWPDRAAMQARASLRQALTAVRKLLSESGSSLAVTADAATVRLAGRDAEIDSRVFDRLADSSAPDELIRAAELYQGDLLEGVALDGPLETWIGGYRAAFHRRALALAEWLSALAEDDDAAARAADTLADRLLLRDSAAEEAHRALIRVFLTRGQQNAARRQLEQCREALRRELDAAPEPATLALLEKDTDEMPAAQPAARGRSEHGTATDATPPSARSSRPGASLVVMPFDNLSSPDDGYFVDGVVEEITAALSRIREFFVVARQSAFTYKGRFVDVREVGRELGVRYVIEGTVRRGGDRLRITVQLVDAETRSQLWSDRYEGDLADIFALQDAIASQVAGALHPSIRASEIEAARSKPPDNLEAYDLVLRALPHFWAHTREDNRKAIAFLDQALQRDPDYGEALAFKAWCHAQEACYLWSDDPASEQAAALRLATQAAKRVEDHATALIAIGAALNIAGADRELAASYLERALAIDPNNAWGWLRLGWASYYLGRFDQAVEHFEHALRLSPFDPFVFNVYVGLGSAWAMRGEHSKGIALIERGLRANPAAVWAYRSLAWMHAREGDLDKATEAVRMLLAHYPDVTIASMKASVPPSIFAIRPDYLDVLEKAGLPRG